MDLSAQRELAALLATLRRDGRQQSGLDARLVPPDQATAYRVAAQVAEELGWADLSAPTVEWRGPHGRGSVQLWLHDLTEYDPYYILPLAMGASMFATQKLSPQPADNTQAKMLLYFMPVLFTFMMLRLPSGLTLYILVNNILSIAQQQWLMKRSSKGTSAPAKA